MVSSMVRFHCIQDSQLGPNGVLYGQVPLYTGQPAAPMVSSIERFHCIQDSQLGPNGTQLAVLYREVSNSEVDLYTALCGWDSVLITEVSLFRVSCCGEFHCNAYQL